MSLETVDHPTVCDEMGVPAVVLTWKRTFLLISECQYPFDLLWFVLNMLLNIFLKKPDYSSAFSGVFKEYGPPEQQNI